MLCIGCRWNRLQQAIEVRLDGNKLRFESVEDNAVEEITSIWEMKAGVSVIDLDERNEKEGYFFGRRSCFEDRRYI